MTDLTAPLALRGERSIWSIFGQARVSPAQFGGWLVAGGTWLLVMALAPLGRQLRTGQEAFCYWVASIHAPYALSDWTQPVAYVYSPAFLQAISPLTALPWLGFFGIWTALLILAVRFLTGPRLFAVGVLLATVELVGGNISLLLAVAMVVGFRWPAAWAFVLLTKVTPGIGLLWFVVRREWHSLGIALGATALVVAVSAVLMPGAWLEWVSLLFRLAGRDGTWAAVPIPFLVRVPIAIVVVVWGARTDRRWTVPGGRHAGAAGAVVRRLDDAPRGRRASRTRQAGSRGWRAGWRGPGATLRDEPHSSREWRRSALIVRRVLATGPQTRPGPARRPRRLRIRPPA